MGELKLSKSDVALAKLFNYMEIFSCHILTNLYHLSVTDNRRDAQYSIHYQIFDFGIVVIAKGFSFSLRRFLSLFLAQSPST